MKKLLSVSLSGLLFLAISCKKDSPAASEAYMSLTNGSEWVYDVITNPGTPGSTTLRDTAMATDRDTSINGRTYKIVSHKNGPADYYNISGSDYYRYRNLAGGAGSGLDLVVEELYLKDNAAVGNSWSQTIPVTVPGLGTIPVTYTNSILEKGGSKTVLGNTYNDVITVKTDIFVTGLPPGSVTTDIKSYYARRVGLIQGDYQFTVSLASIDINTQTLLRSANIR